MRWVVCYVNHENNALTYTSKRQETKLIDRITVAAYNGAHDALLDHLEGHSERQQGGVGLGTMIVRELNWLNRRFTSLERALKEELGPCGTLENTFHQMGCDHRPGVSWDWIGQMQD